MPELGEIRKPSEIKRTGYNKLVWHSCIDCGKQRWVTLIAHNKMPLSVRCPACRNRARVQLSNIEKQKIQELHYNQNKSVPEICAILRYTLDQLYLRMDRYGIERRPSYLYLPHGLRKGSHHSEETKQLLASYRGEHASNWRGGISFVPYTPEFNRKLKEQIRQRDNYTCQLCGVPQCECIQPLPIHHIDYDKENNSDFNLIALCHGCNSKVNWNRDKWTRYFQKKLEVRYGQAANQKQISRD